jgi:hypothetical protein
VIWNALLINGYVAGGQFVVPGRMHPNNAADENVAALRSSEDEGTVYVPAGRTLTQEAVAEVPGNVTHASTFAVASLLPTNGPHSSKTYPLLPVKLPAPGQLLLPRKERQPTGGDPELKARNGTKVLQVRLTLFFRHSTMLPEVTKLAG